MSAFSSTLSTEPSDIEHAASAIDIGYLSRGQDPVPALPPADRPIPIAPASQPSVEPRTVRVGLAFAF